MEIRALDSGTVAEFRCLLDASGEGWCWCVAWEVPSWEGWGDRSAGENRALREELWQKGEFHGYLCYQEGEPVGWCRVGPRRTWPKLCAQFGLDAEEGLGGKEEVYAFSCFGMRADLRGRGLTRRFLDKVLADLARRGVRRVEAFPRAASGPLEAGEVWNGPRALFEGAGFRPGAETAPRVHMSRRLGPS